MNPPAQAVSKETMRLNAICPYFTMFPLNFPLSVLKTRATPDSYVLDPFCGRGTTNFAARILGHRTIGIDSSRVAAAATQAKLVSPTPLEIVDAANAVLIQRKDDFEVPEGDFWERAYHTDVLHDLCRLRNALMDGSVAAPIAAALRGIVLGALHGPVGRKIRTYFSNQSPRTFAPKPAYAVRFWEARNLAPPSVDVMEIVNIRAQRYFGSPPPLVEGKAVEGDSRDGKAMDYACKPMGKFDWVITSPPYYGLRTYRPDQWIREWFLGGPSSVDYGTAGQVSHDGRDKFVGDLHKVWMNTGAQCRPGAKLVVRFGSIGHRMIEDPAQLIADSFGSTDWRITEVRHADNAASGKRQADAFGKVSNMPCDEVDVWARWEP